MFDSLEICQSIANKLKDPIEVSKILTQESNRFPHSFEKNYEFSLANGYPAIICFFATMQQRFPEEKWNQTIHNHITFLIEKIHQGVSLTCSLFHGITGICFSIFLASQNETHYCNLLRQWDELLIERLQEEFVMPGQHAIYNNTSLSPLFFSLIDGLSGVLCYALLRRSNPIFKKKILELTELLIKFLSRKITINSIEQPGWCIPKELLLNPEEKTQYPHGYVLLNNYFGILGQLSALINVKETLNEEIPLITETIKALAYWIKNQSQRASDQILKWSYSLKIQDNGTLTPLDETLNRDSWFSGIPAVCHALFRAAKTLKDTDLERFATTTFLSVFSRNSKDWNHMATSFGCGRTGLLSITHQMAIATQNPFLWKKLNVLEGEVKRFYDPNHPVGFRVVNTTNEREYQWVNDPGLLEGATGVALALLSINTAEKLLWGHLFFLC